MHVPTAVLLLAALAWGSGTGVAPQISSIDPGSTIAGGPGLTLVVRGNGFAQDARVRWKGDARPTTWVSSSRLRAAIAPADIAQGGTARVTVVNPGTEPQVSNAVTFTINWPTPVLTALQPDAAVAGAQALELVVTGSNFAPGAVVRWNGSTRTTTVLDAGRARATITAADLAVEDTARIRVANPGGVVSEPKRLFVRHLTPTLTRLTPDHAPAGAAEVGVTVDGTNFIPTAQVRWNDSRRATTYLSSTQVRALIPGTDLTTAGAARVTVATVVGSSTLPSAPLAFTVDPPPGNPVPTLTSVTPATTQAGGEPVRVTVTGSGLAADAAIYWNGAVRPTTHLGASQLSAVIPTALLVPGAAQVTVLNPAPGGGTSIARAVQVVHDIPAISGLSPASATSGSTDIGLTVTGQNFIRTAQVQWNGASRPTSYVGPTQLRALVAAADLRTAGTAQVAVLTQAGTSARRSAPATFTIELGLQRTVSATPQLEVATFHVGGASNPARVMAAAPADLYSVVNGLPPTSWRVSERSDFSGASWRAYTPPLRHTFSSTRSERRTLFLQYRLGDGAAATLSNVAQDDIEVRVFDASGIPPAAWPGTTGEHHRLLCPLGQVLTGIYGDSGAWLDDVGIICAGTRGAVAYMAVYGGIIPEAFTADCPSGLVPRLSLWWAPFTDEFLRRPRVNCVTSQVSRTFDALNAVPVAGTKVQRTANGPFAPLMWIEAGCPDNAFPVGMDAFVGHARLTGQRGIAALGLVCARLE